MNAKQEHVKEKLVQNTCVCESGLVQSLVGHTRRLGGGLRLHTLGSFDRRRHVSNRDDDYTIENVQYIKD